MRNSFIIFLIFSLLGWVKSTYFEAYNGFLSKYDKKFFSQNLKFNYINTDVNLDTSIGEAFHGLASIGDWLMQAPQDHHSLVFYNIVSGEVKEINVSKYGTATSKKEVNFRDKFNGTVSDGKRFIWVAPSWASHALKIDVQSFAITQDFKVNSRFSDAYNGIVLTEKYVWLVTHSKEDLPRINRKTGALTFIKLKEESLGDYNFGNGADNRSFFGGSDNFDGHIFLHPRRSKFIIKVNEESGEIVAKYEHPFSKFKSPNHGYFYGARNVKNKLFFAPWAYKKVVIFDTATEKFKVIDVELTGSSQYNFCSASDGNSIWFPPFKSRHIVKINASNENIKLIDAGDMINSFNEGRTRTNFDMNYGFAGASLVKGKNVWFSSSFESSYIKMPIDYE